jgi:hypothetical protein
MPGGSGSEIRRLGLKLYGRLKVDELVPERVDVPEGAEAIVVDRPHVRDPEVQFVELRESLPERGGAIEKDA